MRTRAPHPYVPCTKCSQEQGVIPDGNLSGARKLRQGRLAIGPVAVGTTVTHRPPHRSVHALLTHTALILDVWRKIAPEGRDVEFSAQADIGR